jgi:hypothetical protein
MPTVHQANFEELDLTFTRVLENGDIRFTENSDTRITDLVKKNTGESTLYAKSTFKPFTSRMFYKQSSLWKQIFPSVKYNNIWKVPQKVYSKINNIWKRIY